MNTTSQGVQFDGGLNCTNSSQSSNLSDSTITDQLENTNEPAATEPLSFDITLNDLRANAFLRYGDLDKVGLAIKERLQGNYYTPDEYYETLLSQLVTQTSRWLDVGCGRQLLPGNQKLAKELSRKCSDLVGIDPDPTIHENKEVHEAVMSSLETYESESAFDLITLRMVAEHISDPTDTLRAIDRLTRPGSHVLIYTVNKWAITSLAALVSPFWFHHRVKRRLWATEERDTFPVHYRMNTRRVLNKQFRSIGFSETFFRRLPDVFLWRFPKLRKLELAAARAASACHLPHFDTCLLGVYEKLESSHSR